MLEMRGRGALGVLMALIRPTSKPSRAPGPIDVGVVPGNGGTFEHSLTRREREVRRWLAQGKTNPEIAMILQMRRRTVEKHMERILVKLGVEYRTAAALMISRADVA